VNQYSLYDQFISETYPRLLQITTGNTVLDGSGDTRSLYVNGNFSADTIYIGSADLNNIFAPIGAIGSGATTFIRNGLNTYTGGTSTSPTVNISAATLSYLSATTISGGTIYSGSTNLYDIFAGIGTIGGASTYVQPGLNIYTGGTSDAPTVNISAATLSYLSATSLSATTLFSGTTNLSTTIISIANAAASAVDTAVQAGSNIVTGGTASAPIISVVASPSLNALTLSGAGQFAGVTSTGLSATTLSAGTLYSGGTNLYNIFATSGSSGEANTAENIGGTSTVVSTTAGVFKQKTGVILEMRMLSAGTNISFITGDTITIQATSSGSATAVQAGSNITTGGTQTAPTVSVVASPSLNALTLSGAGQFAGVTSTGLSATTLSAGTLYSGATNLYSIFARPELVVNSVNAGSNITTGGTAAAPIISVVASPSLNALTLSGAGQFAGVTSTGLSATTVSATTLFSGTTNLSTTIISIANAAGDFTRVQVSNFITTGGTANAPTINLAQNFSGATISGGTIYSGATNLSTTIISIANAAASAVDSAVQAGSNIATGGTASAPIISVVASPSLNALTLSGAGQFAGVTSTGLSATTVSATTLFSGTTNLSTTIISIANAAASAVDTAVQAGSNIATGGTAAAPTISVVASPSLNALTLSGAGQFAGVTATSISGATISGGTLFSGATNLYNIFATTGTSGEANTASNTGGTSTVIATTAAWFKQKTLVDLEFRMFSAGTNISFITGDTITIQATSSGSATAVQAGSNISTGGTQTAPTVSVVASPSLNALTLSGAGQFAGVTATSVSGTSVSATTLFSGTTNLSTTIINIAAATGDFTRVQGSATIVTGGTANAPTLAVQNVVLSVNAGSNITTGGTQTAPTISVTASPSLNALTLSGAGQFAGVTSTGLSATTLSGGTIYSGATNLSTTIISIANAAASAVDSAVQAGSNIATGGTAAAPIISVVASPSLNALTLSGAGQFAGVTSTGLSATTVSATTLFSGTTNLSTTIISIANAAASVVDSAVQAGSNIATGGTAAAPIISVVASPSLNALTLSGAGQFAGITSTTLSSTTVSATTLFSATTSMATIIDRFSTRIQAGSNITTGGTPNAPIVSIIASPSVTGIIASGASSLQATTASSFSASTITGQTYWSGTTTLAQAISNLAGGGSGEINTASNVNGGPLGASALVTLFKQKTGVDLEFRTLSAGTNITFISGDTVTIRATAGAPTISQATLNFGPITSRQTLTSVTISDTSIVSGTSKIIAVLVGDYSTDHPTAEEILLEDVRIASGNLVTGVGFDIVGYCPRGTYGSYKVNYTISY